MRKIWVMGKRGCNWTSFRETDRTRSPAALCAARSHTRTRKLPEPALVPRHGLHLRARNFYVALPTNEPAGPRSGSYSALTFSPRPFGNAAVRSNDKRRPCFWERVPDRASRQQPGTCFPHTASNPPNPLKIARVSSQRQTIRFSPLSDFRAAAMRAEDSQHLKRKRK